MAKLDVLISLYEASFFLEAKLKNLRAQSAAKDCRFIFISCDPKSKTEEYEKFVEDFDCIEIFCGERIKLYDAWNKGIKSSDSEFLTSSNVDDMLCPYYYEEALRSIEKEDAGIVYSHISQTDIPNQWDAAKWENVSLFSTHPFPSSIVGPAPVWRRSLHDKHGMFKDYEVISDALMWHSFYQKGEIFHQIPHPFVLYYKNPHSLERRICPVTKKKLELIDRDNAKGVDL